MRGILLAGGSGTRLYPLTMGVSKQLLPVYDKPMIYYPLSVFLLAGIRSVLIITTPHEQDSFIRALGNGSRYGMELSYASQTSPDGLAQAFTIGEKFVGNSNVALILGDNIFYGPGFTSVLENASARSEGATIFAKQVRDPQRYGVVELDEQRQAISLQEKPTAPRSDYAVTGLYFYDNDVVDIAKKIKPSARGELEITSINEIYMKSRKLFVEILGRGFVWLDTGTNESIHGAGEFVRAVEINQGMKIACLEEIAFKQGFLDFSEFEKIIKYYGECDYGKYLSTIYEDGKL